MGFKSGFITVVGRPNVGKSTLTNAMTGSKLSIVSRKPQTTRNSIKSIHTTKNYQMIFIDTPGIHKPKNRLGEYLVNNAVRTFKGVDVILFVVDTVKQGLDQGDLRIAEELENTKTSVILVINKIDLVKKESVLPLISAYEKIVDFKSAVPVSSLNEEGLGVLKDEILDCLEDGPLYFPEDMITDQPERILAAEIVREKLLTMLSDEIPYGTGVEIVRFEEKHGGRLININANIYCEKKSHKGIIIGKNGKMLKKVGILAREELEILLGTKVFLELWIKVKEGWRNDIHVLKSLGYD